VALRGKLSVWVYAQTNLGQTLCGYGETAVTPTIVVSTCGVFAPGRYIVRLYTDNPATDFDRTNFARLASLCPGAACSRAGALVGRAPRTHRTALRAFVVC
jgi:hypothetical protein